MNHSFNIEVAEAYGIEEAILLENIYFWCKKNKANEMNIKCGKVWTYNTAKAFNELFPYIKESKIYRSIKHLEEDGLIEIGCFNSNNYDRTRWYTVTNKAVQYYEPLILQNEKSNFQNEESILQNDEIIITDINTDINADMKQTTCASTKDFEKPTPQKVFNFYHENKLDVSPERFWNLNNRKRWKNGLSKNWKEAYLNMTGTPEENYDFSFEFVEEHYGKYTGE